MWEFLAHHTNIDAVNKRHEKGFVFTIGDSATIREDYINQTISRVNGDDTAYASREEILDKVRETFNVFHIMIGTTNPHNTKLLPGHTICISREDIAKIPELIISTIQMQKGKKLDDVLVQWEELDRPMLKSALSQLSLQENGLNL